MRITVEKISIWAGILSLLPTTAWLFTVGQSAITSAAVFPLASAWSLIFAGLALIGYSVMVIANFIAHRSHLKQNERTKPQTQRAENTVQFKNVDQFYQTYSSHMLTEAEGWVRTESDQYQPGLDREKYLVRVAAMRGMLLIFERAWLIIYGSQLKALHDLNISGLKTYDQLRTYYDDAVRQYPEGYKGITFEMWVGFLKSFVLVREHDPTHIEITIRGQEFLRYLVESRYDPSLKRG